MKTRSPRQLGVVALVTVLLSTLAWPAFGERVLRRAGTGEPSTLDPHLWLDGWEGNIVQELFQGLTALDAAANVVPGAAESWTLSDDGKTYVFTLREGLTWSDGVPLTAEDFVYSFRRIVDPATASPMALYLFDIVHARAINAGTAPVEELAVRALDPLRVEITLERPVPYFPELIVHRGKPVPKHVVEKLGRQWTRPGNMVSNDAFRLESWTVQGPVKLVKNERFYDAENVDLDVMIHIPIEDLRSGLSRFRAGELDILPTFAPGELEWVKKNLSEQLHLVPVLGLHYYAFNTQKPPFNDARVRRALSMAMDRRILTERVLKGGEAPAFSLVPEGVRNYPDRAELSFKDDAMSARIGEAKSLLQQAGFGPGKPLKLQLRYTNSETHRQVAVATAAMWKRIGVRSELLNSEQRVLISKIRTGDFEVAQTRWYAEVRDPMTFVELLYSPAGPAINVSRYQNPDLDALIDRAKNTVDVGARAELILQAEQLALRDQGIAPIYFYMGKRLIQPWVKGWVDNPRGIHLARWLGVDEAKQARNQ